jgi:hypothetical protein
VDLSSRSDCAAKFRSNVEVGWIVFVAIMADKLANVPAA